jgi:hypothetical protein
MIGIGVHDNRRPDQPSSGGRRTMRARQTTVLVFLIAGSMASRGLIPTDAKTILQLAARPSASYDRLTQCDSADCQTTAWTVAGATARLADAIAATVVWGSTVMWRCTVVWGSDSGGSASEPVLWPAAIR